MREDEVEYLIDNDITIAPAEDIPIDGTIPVEDFESFNKKKKKQRKVKTKKTKKEKDSGKEVKEAKPKKAKKSKKKVSKKTKKTEGEGIKIEESKKEEKQEPSEKTADTDIKKEEPKEQPITPEAVKTEPQENNIPDYDQQKTGGIKYFGITVLIIILIIAAIFSLRYCGSKEEIVQIETPSGDVVNVIASSQYSYNGYDFSQGNDGLWYTYVKVDPQTEYYVRLHHGPVELEKIPVEGDIDESFEGVEKVYLTFDPEGESLSHITLATGEIGTNFVKAFRIGLEGACTVNRTKACEQRPIITCDNTDKPTIMFKEDTETKVILDGNCVTIQGEGEDIVKASERLLYYLYGVMQR